MRMTMKKLWWNWKKGVHKINTAIAFILMGITYWTAVMPVAVFFKVRGEKLLDRELGAPSLKSYWIKKEEPHSQDIRRSQRLY